MISDVRAIGEHLVPIFKSWWYCVTLLNAGVTKLPSLLIFWSSFCKNESSFMCVSVVSPPGVTRHPQQVINAADPASRRCSLHLLLDRHSNPAVLARSAAGKGRPPWWIMCQENDRPLMLNTHRSAFNLFALFLLTHASSIYEHLGTSPKRRASPQTHF